MDKIKPRNIEHGVVIPCGDENRIPASAEWAAAQGIRGMHYGWPGITRASEGHLLVGASERLIHIDPFGREVVARSEDNGRTWSEAEVLFDSLTDDRDIALNTMPDGTVVATWFSSSAWTERGPRPEWQPMMDRVTPDTLRALSRGWLRRSHDGGRTWEERVYPTIVGQHAGPTCLSNGDIVYCGPYRDEPNNKQVMLATRSSDGGRAWQIIGEVPGEFFHDEHTGRTVCNLNENHVIETGPDCLLAAFRVYNEPRNIHIARSSDGGRTWTVPQDIGVYGFPPYLLRLQSGAILCVFAERIEPRRVSFIVSYDGGLTWDTDNKHTLRQFDFRADMGYPSAIETEPGEVFCIYYAIPKHTEPGYDKLDMRQWGILSTRFRVD